MNKDEAKMDNQDSEPDDCPGLMNCRERKYSIYSTDTEERVSIECNCINYFYLCCF